MLCLDCIKFLLVVMFDVSLKNFCVKKYEEVSSNLYVKNVCFESNYVYEFFVYGYGLFVDKKIFVGKKFGRFQFGLDFGSYVV